MIRISKSGEAFSSVTEADGIYQPVFAVKGLEGAVYEITAAEDIITPDGTLRYAAGAVVDTVTTDAQKKELFAKVRSGEVRVLLGSTPKMGAGTNVQDRLIAIHNLDCPWRPSDVGRILRTFKIKKNVEVTDNGKIII